MICDIYSILYVDDYHYKDAMWKFYGYHTYPQSDPSVTVISAESPHIVYKTLSEGKVTKLFIYFNRSNALRNISFTEFYQLYSYKTKHVVDETYNNSTIMLQTKVFKLSGMLMVLSLPYYA